MSECSDESKVGVNDESGKKAEKGWKDNGIPPQLLSDSSIRRRHRTSFMNEQRGTHGKAT